MTSQQELNRSVSPAFLSSSLLNKSSSPGNTPTSTGTLSKNVSSITGSSRPTSPSKSATSKSNNNNNNKNDTSQSSVQVLPLLPAASPSVGMFGRNRGASTQVMPAQFAAASSAPLQFEGWLYKHAVGTSLIFKKKNWQLRFFKSNTETISYYDSDKTLNESTCKRTIRWKDVTHVYDVLNSGMRKEASDPERFYFGVRFYAIAGSDQEFVLVLRVDNPAERHQWVAHLLAVQSKINNMKMTATGPVYSYADGDRPPDSGYFSSHSQNLFAANRAAAGDDDNIDLPGTPSSQEGLERRSAKGRGWLVEALATPLRNMVSLQKKRFKEGSYDLDLAYIDDDIIAMGFPSVGKEAIVRNPMDHVVKFLEERHGKRFHVFNLCSERFYPPSAFEGKFDRFPFDDHNAPPIELFLPFCHRAAEIMRRPVDANGKSWAIAVHCKAGKGRTGVMIAALLMYLGRCANDKESLEYFARKRTKDKKGVQIPSQIRYAEYFYRIRSVFNDSLPPPVKVNFKRLILSSIPHFDSDGGADPFILVQARRETHGHRPLGTNEGSVHNPLVTILDTRTVTPAKHVIGVENYPVDINCVASGDVRIVLLDQDGFGQDELMAAFWVHTSFLPKEGTLTLKKKELDFAVKEKIRIDESFYVTLKYEFV